MANRFPIVLDTTAGELKEIPSGDTLDLTNNQIIGITGLTVAGTIDATRVTQAGTSILELVQYDDLLNKPSIPSDVSDLSDTGNRIPRDVNQLTDNDDLLGGAGAFVELSDTPDSFVGQANKILKVNGDESGLYFTDSSGAITGQDVIDALGYTPYNETNPSNFLTASDVTSGIITDALGYTPYDGATNANGYITGITVTDITDALGYTPYNGSTNPNGYFASTADINSAYGYTPYDGTANSEGFINDANGINTALGYTPYDGDTNANNFLAAGDLTATDINDALGYTAYDGDTNPNNYINNSTGISEALGFTPYDDTNPDGYITGISDNDVITALGFTPYNSTNPSGYVSTSTEINDLYGYVPYDGVTNSQNFLTAEADTLSTVVARGASTTLEITAAGFDAGSSTIQTTGNIAGGTASIGSITTGTTSVIDGDTAGDTLRLGGTAALTLSSSSSITLGASLVGNDAFKGLGTSATPFGTAYVTDGTIGGVRLNSETISNTDGDITITPGTNDRIIVNAGSLGMPVKTPTTKGNLTPSSGDTVYVNDGSSQYAQTYDGGGSVWRTITGPRYVAGSTANPNFNGAYVGEMIVYEDDDGGQTLRVWIFDDNAAANVWATIWESA